MFRVCQISALLTLSLDAVQTRCCTKECGPDKKCTNLWHVWGWTQHCTSRRRRGIRPFPEKFKSYSLEYSYEQ
ncbi:hypothetical protein L596_013921 [Steinernema carpocapsae]|uniref:Secreted protein n=1 Tax=Steinernema carpocapsae TaxID=34508 RepID=A0A4U5P2R0_STECR|nr:hypothetical protein L596_013921 [Steinernema carpocapsae]